MLLMQIVSVVCAFNLFFLIDHFQQFIFLNKSNRKFNFPDLIHITDTVLAGLSLVLFNFINYDIFMHIDPKNGERGNNLRLSVNLTMNEDFNVEYIFAAITICLTFRCALNLQYFEAIGPLIKILDKMTNNLINFTILYGVLLALFTLIGNFNFMRSLSEFDGLVTSLITTIDASMGKYDSAIFNNLPDNKRVIGQMYQLTCVISFKIVLLNLLISLLTQTYLVFEDKSNGLFLKKILSKRDELINDKYCGSFLIRIPPFDCLQLPLLPLCAALPYSSEMLEKLNSFLTKLKYSLLMSVFYLYFLASSLILIPPAWIFGTIRYADSPVEMIIFAFCGPLILVLDVAMDSKEYWNYNFKTDLSKIVVDQPKSSITNRTIKEVTTVCQQFVDNKLKAVTTQQLIKIFRLHFEV